MIKYNLVCKGQMFCWLKDERLFRYIFFFIPYVSMLTFNIICLVLSIYKKKKINQSMEESGIDYIASSSDSMNYIEGF
jgi:hypothetical protein